LKGLENIDHLMTTGLYAKLRHPMYTGFILWIAGWIIRCGAAVGGIIGLLASVDILYWRGLEECRLISVYGDAYLKYRQASWF